MKKIALFFSLTLSLFAQAQDEYLQLTVKEISRRGLHLVATVTQAPGLEIESNSTYIDFSNAQSPNRMRFPDQLDCTLVVREAAEHGRILRPGRSFTLGHISADNNNYDTVTGIAGERFSLYAQNDQVVERIIIQKSQLDFVYIHLFELQQACQGIDFTVVEDTDLVDAK